MDIINDEDEKNDFKTNYNRKSVFNFIKKNCPDKTLKNTSS